MSFKNLSGFKFEREVSVDPYISFVDRRFYMSCQRETVGCRIFDGATRGLWVFLSHMRTLRRGCFRHEV